MMYDSMFRTPKEVFYTYQSLGLCSPKLPATQKAHKHDLLLGAIVRVFESE
jgi:hypothetical protein